MILVEGESDRVALEVLGKRVGVRMLRILVTGGSGGARRAVDAHSGERLFGLVDANERIHFERMLDHVFVCDPDLEGEFVHALGVDAVLDVIAAQGELDSFRLLQRQPFQRTRSVEEQLARFFGGRSGNKVRYARLMASAVPLDRVPLPLAALLAAASE